MGEWKPMVVACRCGWQGEDTQLISWKTVATKYCPACGRAFKPLPSPPIQQARSEVEG
jgi:hypothetical protein